jgi:transposase
MDIERLRQAALLFEQENARLFRRLEALLAELAEARGEAARSLLIEIECLKEQLASRTKALLGDSSERRPSAEQEKTEEHKEPRPGEGPRKQKAFPIVEMVHELDEPDQTCPSCGGDLEPMAGQFEEADEIDVVERSFRIVRHKRQKDRCRCGAGIETSLGPDKLIAGGRYSIDFAVDVAIAKFADHRPLDRQVRQMARDGLAVDSSTLWEQTWFLSRHLMATCGANRADVLISDVIALDETWWRLMKKGASKRWWVWSVAWEDAVSYRLRPRARPTRPARCSAITLALPSATATRCTTCWRGSAKARISPWPTAGRSSAEVPRSGAPLPRRQRDPRTDRPTLCDRGGGQAGKPQGADGDARRPKSKTVEAGHRRDSDVADSVADASALGVGEGHRVHERSVAGAGAVPRRPEDAAGHQ